MKFESILAGIHVREYSLPIVLIREVGAIDFLVEMAMSGKGMKRKFCADFEKFNEEDHGSDTNLMVICDGRIKRNDFDGGDGGHCHDGMPPAGCYTSSSNDARVHVSCILPAAVSVTCLLEPATVSRVLTAEM